MSRAVVIVQGQADRERVQRWAAIAPAGCRIEFKEPRRTTPQNDRMWAMLTEVARQVPWHGLKLSADDWKLIFLASLHQEMRLIPNLDGTGFVNLGRSSSDLSKQEMSDVMELIAAFGASHGVAFHDQQERAA